MIKLDDFQKWLLSNSKGRYTLDCERVFYHNIVSRVFGYYALQVGLPKINFLQENKIPNHYVLQHDIKSDFEFLPFAENTFDLIICPHTLEFIPNYQHFLQECYRVLIHNGKIIFTNFNKNSIYKFLLLRDEIITELNLISLDTLKQQLVSLNFFIEGGKFLSFRPLINNPNILSKLAFMEKIGDRWLPTLANNYAIIASKELVNPTIIKATEQFKNVRISPQYGTTKICKIKK